MIFLSCFLLVVKFQKWDDLEVPKNSLVDKRIHSLGRPLMFSIESNFCSSLRRHCQIDFSSPSMWFGRDIVLHQTSTGNSGTLASETPSNHRVQITETGDGYFGVTKSAPWIPWDVNWRKSPVIWKIKNSYFPVLVICGWEANVFSLSFFFPITS